MKLQVFLILLLTTTASFVGKTEMLWSNVSATLLHGNNYQVGDNERSVFTFEHSAKYSWGDSFLFIDRLHSSNGKKQTYSEVSPRFKISNYQNQAFKNIYISTTAEIGENFTHYLIGIGTKLKIPHFTYANINIYHRNNDSAKNNQQITVNWAVPLGPLTYDGFIDYVITRGNANSSMNFTSQLKYNVAKYLNLKTKLYVGVEYNYWLNKFGIDNVDEKNVNLLIKYHF